MNIAPLNEAGKPVDWWFLYKVPKLIEKSNTDAKLSATGFEYVYFDAVQNKVTFSPNQLNDGKGALDLTLNAIFTGKDASTGWILYNDEVPADAHEKDSSLLGHTKGVIAFDVASKTGLWLLHSWPKYADPGAKAMPTPIYGQTFLCLAIDLATASAVAKQMAEYQQPQIYLPHLPNALAKSDPLYVLTQPLNKAVAPGTNDLPCKTRGGLAFHVIAKNREWGKDFWNDLVGPTLKEDMNVETWIRGKIPPTLDSDGVHKTFDIKFIDLRQLGAPWAWPETRDHAKWGITLNDPWICVGDINRMISQERRGGGTIALQNKALWQALKKTDLMIPPPGMSMATAKQLVANTHKPE